MKYLYLASFFIMIGCVVNAQLTVLPQWGIESNRTTVSYNNSSGYSPLGTRFSPHASLRLDYKFKKGHGPFLGIATSRSGVNYTYSNPETAMTDYTATRDNKKLRLEGGYQVSSKRIYFNKSSAKSKSVNVPAENNKVKKSCRDYYVRSHCGSKASKSTAAKSGNKGSWVSIQPSAGMAYIPAAESAGIFSNSPGMYEYNAGNWKTAFVAGAGFAFGKNNQEKIVVSVNYLKGIGNLNTKSITTNSTAKSVTTNLSSAASNWNLRLGIPLTFGKKQVAKTTTISRETIINQPGDIKQPKQEKKCGASMYRCRKAA